MRFNDLFSLMGQIFKNTNFQKENQGQGRRVYRDRDYYKEWDANRRQGGWDREPQSRDSNEPRQYANTAAVSGRKSGKSEPRFNKYGSSVVVERILIISHTLHLQMMCFRVSTGSVRQISNMMVARCLMHPGSETSEYNQSFYKTEDHEATEEPLQESPSKNSYSTKNQSLDGYGRRASVWWQWVNIEDVWPKCIEQKTHGSRE